MRAEAPITVRAASAAPHGSLLTRRLLWVDCCAGLVAGVVVLSLSAWLSELYAMPRWMVVGVGAANAAYGAFSLSLARRARRPRSLVVFLVTANAAWAVLCAVAVIALASSASAFGLAHLVAEGLFVGGLATVEWRHRDRLLEAA